MKNFMQLYKNVEIASPVFDLGHILRRSIREKSLPEIGVIDTPISLELRSEFRLMSTKINDGIPGCELINFLELLFDNCPIDVSAKYIKKYLGGLKALKDEYEPSPQFKDLVMQEAKSYV